MLKRLVFAALIAALLVPAAADAARTRSLDGSSGRFAAVDSANNVTIYAGVLKGGPIGRGTAELRVRPGTEPNTVRATGTLFNAFGTVQVAWTNTVEPQPDGSIKFVGSGRFLDGTRRYRNASGRFTFEATSQPADPQLVVAEFDGTIRY